MSGWGGRASVCLVTLALTALMAPLHVRAGAGDHQVDNVDPEAGISWLALGDSYSSGMGASEAVGDCGRSPKAYAPLASGTIRKLATGRPGTDLEFLACSAAKLRSTDRNSLAGQIDKAAQPKYDLITVTFGGNDIGFGDAVRKCYLGVISKIGQDRRCGFNLRKIEQSIETMGRQLESDYKRKLLPRLTDGGHIIVLGYPKLFADPSTWMTGDAKDCKAINYKDVRDINRAGDRLISTVRRTVHRLRARSPNIHFLDVHDGNRASIGFGGHNPCAGPEEWLNSIRGRWETGGKDPLSHLDPSYHPNNAGYRAEAKMITWLIESLDWTKLQPGWIQVAEPGFGEVQRGSWWIWIPFGSAQFLGRIMVMMAFQRTVGLGLPVGDQRQIQRACGKGYTALYWGAPNRSTPQKDFAVLMFGDVPVGYRLYTGSPSYSTSDGINVGADYSSLLLAYPGKVFQAELSIDDERRVEYEIRSKPNRAPLHGTVENIGGIDRIVARYAGEQCGLEGSWQYEKSTAAKGRTKPGPGGKGGTSAIPAGTYHWAFRPYSDWLHQDKKGSMTKLLVSTPVWEGTFRIDKSGNVSGSASSKKYVQTVRCADYQQGGLTWSNGNGYIRAKAKLAVSGNVEGKQLKLTVRRHGFTMTQLGSGDKGELVPKGCDHGVGLSSEGKQALATLKRAFSGPPVEVTARPNDFLRIWAPLDPVGGRCYKGEMTKALIEGSDFEFTMNPSERTDPRPNRIMALAKKGQRGCA